MTRQFRIADCRLQIVLLLLCLMVMTIPWGAAQSEDPFKLRVDVDLVTIEATVLGKDGKPVRNLKKEDFVLYEDGKKQEILSFDEVIEENGNSPKEMSLLEGRDRRRGKTVLVIFVDTALSPQLIQESRISAEKFVKQHMGPQDLFAVGTFEASMKILQNLTNDRQEVLAAIGQSVGSNPAGQFYFEDLLRSLEQISLSIARLKAQKMILFYGPSDFGYAPGILTVYGNMLKSARKSNVVFYLVDPRRQGSVNSSTGPETAARFNSGTAMPARIHAASSGGVVAVTLKSIVSDSGGISIDNVMDYDSELDILGRQISNYYVLGFQSSNPKHDGSYRKIKVESELKGVSLRHRPGYQDRSPVDVLASSKQEKNLLTALATPGAAAQLPITFRPMYFYDSARTARVLIAARILMGKMAFKKKGGQLGTDLNIMGVAYAENGSIAARFSETLPISFEKEKEAEFRRRSLAYGNYFRLRPGKYRLKLAVSDESNNLGAIEQLLELPAMPEQGLAGSSVVLAEQTSRLPDLIRNLRSQMLDESDPLVYSGLQVEPSVENKVPAGSAVPVLFRIYNLPVSPDQWDLTATPRLLNEKGNVFPIEPISLKKSVSPMGNRSAIVGLTLPLQGAVPGKYRLVIELTEAASGGNVVLQTDLEFVK